MTAMLNYWMLASRRLLLFGLFPILVGSIAGLQGWLWNQDAAAFAENLRTVDGRVLRITPDGDDLLLDVEYQTEAGVRHKQQIKVASRLESGLRTVGKVSLIYDLRYPQLAELGDVVSAHNEKRLYVGITAAGGLLCLAGGFFLGHRARQTARILTLFKSGTLVQTEVRDSALAPGSQTGRFTYAFRGPNARWYEGKSPEMNASQLREWPVGKRILAAYDPANPRSNEADIFGIVDEKRRGAVLTADS